MGRNTTGIATANTSMKLTISSLNKNGLLTKRQNGKWKINWEGGANLCMELNFSDFESYMRLSYYYTDYEGEKKPMDYKVYFKTIPSNLGNGEIFYFICPQSFKPCRILYLAYHSPKFKSRKGYRNTIYYNCQTYSKMNWYNSRYWALDSQLEDLYKQRATYTYKGKKTRRAKRIEYLEEKKEYMDSLRISPFTMRLSLRRIIFGHD